LAEAEKLNRPEGEDIPPGRTRNNRVLRWIIGVVALWLIAMSGSIWRSGVPHAGWKATVLALVGLLFLGGWMLALGTHPRPAVGNRKPEADRSEPDSSPLDPQSRGD
jgi:hypothetical protein